MGIDGAGRRDHNHWRDLLAHDSRLLTPNFDIKSLSTGDAVVIEVSGDVDLLTAPPLSEELRRAQRTHSEVIVDLEQVEFMDCAALRVLVGAATAWGPGQSRISVTPGPPQVQKLFRLTGMDRQLRIVERSPVVRSSGRRPRWGWDQSAAPALAADTA